jgi:hypothetical protein
MNKKERPRYNAIRLRVTAEMQKAVQELSNELGGKTEAYAVKYLMTMGLITTIKFADDPKHKEAAKKFLSEYWDKDGLIPKELVNNL